MTCPRCHQAVAPLDLFCGFCRARLATAGAVGAYAGDPVGSAPVARRATAGAVELDNRPAGPTDPAGVGDPSGSPAIEHQGPFTAGDPEAVRTGSPPAAARAGFVVRAAAAIVDSVLLSLWGGLVALWVLGRSAVASGAALGTASGGSPTLGEGLALDALALTPWAVGVWLSIVLAYLVGFVALEGATPGKLLLRLHVVRADGGAVGWCRAALREVAGKALSVAVLGVGYLIVAVGRDRRGLHDLVAGTVVVHRPRRP